LRTARPATGLVVANGTGRAATRGASEVIELEHGISVHPAREGEGRWRAKGARVQGMISAMASTAAYSGLRWGELTVLTIPQIDQGAG
jgi:hypothetical protein